MKTKQTRRNFIKTTASATIGMSLLSNPLFSGRKSSIAADNKRIGIIGLDTSHSVAFTEVFNEDDGDDEFAGYRVVAAYPKGSSTIKSSYERIPKYTERVKEMGVEIVDSIEELIDKSDVVLLETNDGRLHLEQAIPVLEAGKTMFVDKPVTASLSDAILLYDKAEQHGVPIWSSSSLRYMEKAQAVAEGDIGEVLGAFTYSPATIEETHPDLFWYGIHGIELLYTIMGKGCNRVERVYTEDTDMVTGVWQDGRIGTFRGMREGQHDYGGMAFGSEDNMFLGEYQGYRPLLKEIVQFFETGQPPVSREETLELLAFMEAADESKRLDGATVNLGIIWERAREETRK
ncbi:MAG: Gfo/Idh/MocA family protein [Bacteroidales bacterium]